MRDVTWRPTRQPKALSRRRGRLRLLIILLAVNIGVVLYHGDPRAQLTERIEAPQGSEPVCDVDTNTNSGRVLTVSAGHPSAGVALAALTTEQP